MPRVLHEVIPLILAGILLAVAARNVQGAESEYYIDTEIHIDGKVAHTYRFTFPSFEQCFMRAIVVQRRYALAWRPKCKLIGPLTSPSH